MYRLLMLPTVLTILTLIILPSAYGRVPASCQTPQVIGFEACTKNDNAIIGGPQANPGCDGQVAFRSGSHDVHQITINSGGTLILNDEAASDFELTTTGIDIKGGSLLIGNPECPIGTSGPAHKVLMRFTGEKPTTRCG